MGGELRPASAACVSPAQRRSQEGAGGRFALESVWECLDQLRSVDLDPRPCISFHLSSLKGAPLSRGTRLRTRRNTAFLF